MKFYIPKESDGFILTQDWNPSFSETPKGNIGFAKKFFSKNELKQKSKSITIKTGSEIVFDGFVTGGYAGIVKYLKFTIKHHSNPKLIDASFTVDVQQCNSLSFDETKVSNKNSGPYSQKTVELKKRKDKAFKDKENCKYLLYQFFKEESNISALFEKIDEEVTLWCETVAGSLVVKYRENLEQNSNKNPHYTTYSRNAFNKDPITLCKDYAKDLKLWKSRTPKRLKDKPDVIERIFYVNNPIYIYQHPDSEIDFIKYKVQYNEKEILSIEILDF